MRNFLIWPAGNTEEVTGDGDTTTVWPTPDLYNDLLLAGCPLHGDVEGGRWDGVIDVAVTDDRQVVAFTRGPESREHVLGDAAQVFLRWYTTEAV